MASNNSSAPPLPPPLPSPPEVFQVSRQRRTTNISAEKREIYKKAWQEVKDGSITIYAAAKLYKLSKTTLRNWCLKGDIEDIVGVGRPCYFGSDLETKLESWVLESSRLGKFFFK